ncbi:MAG: hypothetical protein J6Y02_23800 [Pseudobutyrivibrio sp.]|nr:hypothetical protein [Pseudobutyrivibrio sp.]
MENLENMSIDELVELNRDIQKVLKEKRKARHCAETKFGKYIKIEIDRDSEGMLKRCVFKIRQRYTPDSYITVIASDPISFNEELINLTDSVGEAYLYMRDIIWKEKEE